MLKISDIKSVGKNGRYLILGVINHGSFAKVFEAKDTQDERIVAVKI